MDIVIHSFVISIVVVATLAMFPVVAQDACSCSSAWSTSFSSDLR